LAGVSSCVTPTSTSSPSAIFPTTSSKATALSDFVTYAIGPGQKFGAKLHFAPLPPKVVSATKQTLAKLG